MTVAPSLKGGKRFLPFFEAEWGSGGRRSKSSHPGFGVNRSSSRQLLGENPSRISMRVLHTRNCHIEGIQRATIEAAALPE